ncbi:carboxynorspermidine decarboxylase [Pectinatus brassicae]|uniref:Carboxynorspermidine decarboxylase n=1 Tax=Pectinatus brassicae TaxID=862415 RepID=A0A840UNS5_9FIRM|nr:carboxynorspermidine decarboxylase [Pectinatus brassicae]MBB5335862.1 carboxynorspermidine decarboxylase [Pectinatus brassicae]
MQNVFDAAKKLPSPCYIIYEELLEKNLQILAEVQRKANCKILLAQKAFSMYYFYPLISKYLSGATASGIYEARLTHEYMQGGENHIFSPAYSEVDFPEIVKICNHIVFNSFAQWDKFKEQALKQKCQCGLRINPEFSTQDHVIYDPCAPGSRLGITLDKFTGQDLEGISGLHFHTLCEQGAEDLAATLKVIEEKFGKYLYKMKWLNFGGGHLITRQGYNINLLIDLIKKMQQKYDVEIYLEPGEAVALDAGFLSSSVLEIAVNGQQNVILDTSAACHMPDVIEMPYRPNVIEGFMPKEEKYTYTFGGPTCLAGDIIGEYSFAEPLKIGDKIIFCDMAIYSMVKNNTFNGMPLPAIAAVGKDGKITIVKRFNYDDFKMRLS